MDNRLRRYRSDHDLTRCGTLDNGTYRSRWYRGLAPGMEWLRLSLVGTRPGALVQVYTTDAAPPDTWDPAQIPAMESTEHDLLLYGVYGQYLCFSVTPAEGVAGYELAFPGRSIEEQLPESMQGDPVLRRLLGIYQSGYMDINGDYAQFPERLDAECAAHVMGLPHWVGATQWLRSGLPAEKLLANAQQLNRMRGTRRGLMLLLELVAGVQCTIVERTQWQGTAHAMPEREACSQLYGSEESVVTILIPAQVPSERVRVLKDLLADFVPLGVSYTVVHLTTGAPMDGHSYLDDNAQLVDDEQAAVLDGQDGVLILE